MLTDKEIFESLMALAQIGGGIGAQDVDRIVRAVASAYVNPNGRTAQALIQAAIRYENVTNPVLPAYDERSRAEPPVDAQAALEA